MLFHMLYITIGQFPGIPCMFVWMRFLFVVSANISKKNIIFYVGLLWLWLT